MGSSPIPPHERTWRHPSELASAEWHAIRDAESPRSTRGFAIATGTLGLVAVGVLIFTVTPGAQGSPVAVSATSPTVSHTSPVRATPVGARTAPAALATPIGDGHLALMTMTGVAAGLGTEIDVQLTNGPVVTAVVDATTPGVMIVSIHSGSDGHQIADTPPAPDDMVTVLAEPPVKIAYAAVSTINAKEGTPVVDGHGDLIGLCTQHTDDDDDDGGPAGGVAQPIRLIDVTGDSAIDAQRAVSTTIAP